MSSSSLWAMNKNFNGEELTEFSNSWLFSPIIWDILFEKYLPNKVNDIYGKQSLISASMFDKSIFGLLNNKINNSDVIEDRILWELSNQQVFFTKDKQLIGDSINNFLDINNQYTSEIGGHIHERFTEIAEKILNIDENEYSNLIFKNTSVDDNVEYWFSEYDEEIDEYKERPLNELDKRVTEFVFIENGKIVNFMSNLDYFQ